MRMIFSNSLDEMVYSGFTIGRNHYTWNDEDCVYWNDDVDDDFYMTVPDKAVIDK